MEQTGENACFFCLGYAFSRGVHVCSGHVFLKYTHGSTIHHFGSIRDPRAATSRKQGSAPQTLKTRILCYAFGKKHTIGCTWMYWVRPLFALRCAKTIRNRALICSCRAFFLPIPSGLTDPFGVDKVRHPQIHLSIGGPRAQPGKSSGCLRISLTLSAGKSLTRTHLSWCKHGNYVHAQC